ncbi:proteophosphoglycan ppg4 [Rhodotorula toruloides]|uniref:Proteophosphoglycan ppg4 n=1 Tax=Rhodotorula toruloides TaxID=5286 RepID=A0A511KQG6_RHOTO|nr:proteophosphoglycan ppg4 [Rhodotorula toruloides]
MSSSTGAVSSGNPQSQSGRSAAVKSSMELEYSKKGYRDPWSYVEAQAKWVKSKKGLDEEKDWASSSHLMYAHFEVDEQGFVKAVERSAITGIYRNVTLESAHLVSASRFARLVEGKKGEARNVTDFRGKRAIKWLIVAKVVPKCADVNCDANRIKMETGYHAAFDAGRLRLVPNADLVLVRLVNEIKHQEDRAAALERRGAAAVVPQKRGPPNDSGEVARPFLPPVRPDFENFYETLERIGAIFRLFATIDISDPLVSRRSPPQVFKLEGLNLDSCRRKTVDNREEPPEIPNSDYPVLPPLLVPVSMNLLIYAVKESVAIAPPVSFAVMDETRRLQGIIHLLISFWMLDDDSTEEDIRALVAASRQRVLSDYPGSTWADALQQLGSLTPADLASRVQLPASLIDSRSAPPPPPQGSSQRVDFETGKVETGDPIDAQAYDEVTLDAPSSPPLAHPPRMPAALSPKAELLQKYLDTASYARTLGPSVPIR